jgi:squalene cyclase
MPGEGQATCWRCNWLVDFCWKLGVQAPEKKPRKAKKSSVTIEAVK